jgi:hypothetical protein
MLIGLFVTPALCTVGIEIIDVPTEGMLYSPIYVTVKLSNYSTLGEAVCINEGETRGWFVEKSKSNELLALSGTNCRDSDNVVWLEPGQTYLMRTRISDQSFESGIHEIRAVLNGDGKCYLNWLSRPTLPKIKELPLDEWRPVYECWRGTSKSSIHKIMIREPEAQEDIEALNYILKTRKWPPVPTAFKESYTFLKQHYPYSNYTYTAGLHAGAYSEIMQLQPGNLMETSAAVNLILFTLYQKKTELDQSVLQKLPIGLREYVLQIEQENLNPARKVKP